MADSPVKKMSDAIRLEQGTPEMIPQPQMSIRSIADVTPPGESVSDHALPGNTPAGFPAGYLADKLEDAECLLMYAAEAGIEVDATIRQDVLQARITRGSHWTEPSAARLLAALTHLAAQLRPVTAESLKVCAKQDEVQKTMGVYKKVALCLAVFIIPFSLATFVTSAISDAMRKDLENANSLAVKLGDELGPLSTQNAPPDGRGRAEALPRGVMERDIIWDLQQFAATIRAIDARARQLRFFVPYPVADPFVDIRADRVALKAKFELPVGLPDFSQAAVEKIGVLQDVRAFAQSIQETVSTFYGALATCILPVLYALLGACAFLLRSFEEQIKTRTFTLSDVHLARFVIAAIGGAVVGLFNNFTVTQGASIPPL